MMLDAGNTMRSIFAISEQNERILSLEGHYYYLSRE
jgi:hypothetical protein